MSLPVKTLKFRSSVRAINTMLTENKFNGFPIVNGENQCIGVINRYSLLVILRNIERIKGIEDKKGVEQSYG
jgi:predicted transcriptional regulator